MAISNLLLRLGLTQITLLYRVSDLDRTAQIKIFRQSYPANAKSWRCYNLEEMG